MQSVNAYDLKLKVGDVLQTIDDFVVVENVDEGPVGKCHTRSIRTGRQGIASLKLITGIMMPVVHEAVQQTFEHLLEPVLPSVVPAVQVKPKGYDIVKGPALQPKARHQHNMLPATEPTPMPSIIHEKIETILKEDREALDKS